MSTTELLNHVKALSASARKKFIMAVLALEKGGGSQPNEEVTRVTWPDIEARAKRIFGARVLPMLPNLVLLEGQESDT